MMTIKLLDHDSIWGVYCQDFIHMEQCMWYMGKKGADKVSFFPVELVFGGSRQRECGLDFEEYELDDNVCTEAKDELRSVYDGGIEDGHCLLLPFRKQGMDFAREYGVVFDD